MTLPEVVVGAAIGAIVIGALMVGAVALQRAFSANSQLARSDSDLVRVADYMSKDIRNATSVTAGATTSPAPGETVILRISTVDYYDRKGTPNNPADDVANTPVLTRTGVSYGTRPVAIRYLKSGSRIAREVTRTDNGVNTTSVSWIADAVNDLTVTFDANQVATITSASDMHYRISSTGKPLRSTAFVITSQSKNQTP